MVDLAARALLIDIDGVLTTSWRAIDGAPEALASLRDAGLPFMLVTNTTSRTRADIAALLVEAGVPVSQDEILTTTAITATYLRAHRPGAVVELLNSGDVRSDLVGVDLVDDGGEVVVIGGAGPEFSYDALNHVFARVEAGAALVAMNPNVVWQTDEGLQLDAGAFVAALEAATGVATTVTGKPAADFFLAALSSLGVAPADAVMVGDDLHTDVLGAQACGLQGVLVRTGKFREHQLRDATTRPDVVVDSFADVPALLGLDEND